MNEREVDKNNGVEPELCSFCNGKGQFCTFCLDIAEIVRIGGW